MFLRNLSISLVIALVTMGYPALAAVLSLLEISDTSLPSVLFRLGVAILAIFAVVVNRKNLHIYHPPFVIAIAVFWIAYIYRILYDSYIVQDLSALYDPVVVLVTAITFVVIPILPGLVGLNEKNKRLSYQLLTWLTICASLLMLIDARQLIEEIVEKRQIRFSLEKLDAISVGYVGGILLILSAINIISSLLQFRLVKLIFCIVGCVVGLFILLVAGSRGPVVSVVVTLLIYWLIPIRIPKFVLGFVLIAGCVITVFNIQGYVLKQFDLDVSTRFVQAQEGESDSIDYRADSFAGAWLQFKESPLFGDSLFERTTGAYPHNLVLEALMATGIVGGVAYLFAIFTMLYCAMRLLVRQDGFEWLALIGIFYLVASQFSGNHWAFAAHWVSLIMVVSTEVATRSEVPKQHRKKRRRARAS